IGIGARAKQRLGRVRVSGDDGCSQMLRAVFAGRVPAAALQFLDRSAVERYPAFTPDRPIDFRFELTQFRGRAQVVDDLFEPAADADGRRRRRKIADGGKGAVGIPDELVLVFELEVTRALERSDEA